eukprot:3115686-Prymnesium_polylepis.1
MAAVAKASYRGITCRARKSCKRVSGRGGGRGVAGVCRARVTYRSGPISRGVAFYVYYYFLDFGDRAHACTRA